MYSSSRSAKLCITGSDLNWFELVWLNRPLFVIYYHQGGVTQNTPQYGIMRLEAGDMGKRKSYYGEDEGLAIRKKMREFDQDDGEHDPDEDQPIPVDQENEDWQERMYER